MKPIRCRLGRHIWPPTRPPSFFHVVACLRGCGAERLTLGERFWPL